MPLPNTTRISAHEVTITDRLVYLVVQGEFTLADAHSYAEFIDAAIPRGEPYVVLGNVTGMAITGPEARRYFAEWHKGRRCERCAIVGATLLARGITTLIMRAMNLTGRFYIPFRFFSNEPAARAWLAEWRPPAT